MGTMANDDFAIVCAEIDKRKDFLHGISQGIWQNPELGYEENVAHDLLTNACEKFGFNTTKHYKLNTAFRAEYSTQQGGPTIAILLEYDALPDIGHACGHNLIAEAGLAAGIAVKAVMDLDQTIKGKIVLIGCPAEEEAGGGKIQLIKAGTFSGIDAAMMVHPAAYNVFSATIASNQRLTANFKGKESHASGFPWEGRNALDAAVSAYSNISMLRQQIRPSNVVNAIITKGGTLTNTIPADTTLEVSIRATTKEDDKNLLVAVRDCIEAGAKAARCKVTIKEHKDSYESQNWNDTIVSVFEKYAKKFGVLPNFPGKYIPNASTDMGNVSHVVPSIHPFYAIGTDSMNHTREYTEAAGSAEAQNTTLTIAKVMALTALQLFRQSHTLLRDVKLEFMRSCHCTNGQ